MRRILPALGALQADRLTKEVIRNFYEEMRAERKLTDGGLISERTVEGLHNTLCSILTDAVEEGYLLHNPRLADVQAPGHAQRASRSR